MNVKIDVFLVFRIVQPYKFIYSISAEKLGDLLRSALEETVRTLARSVEHSKIYDLLSYDESQITKEMNERVRITKKYFYYFSL